MILLSILRNTYGFRLLVELREYIIVLGMLCISFLDRRAFILVEINRLAPDVR